MEKLIDYFDCGTLRTRGAIVDFRVKTLDDILEKIIPFFNKYPVLGVKRKDFDSFCAIGNLIKAGISEETLSEIKKIKSNMNRARK